LYLFIFDVLGSLLDLVIEFGDSLLEVGYFGIELLLRNMLWFSAIVSLLQFSDGSALYLLSVL